ncbi:hypothetical protein ACIP39_11720 [Streptomyces tibetensis]|uniref:hypothetical protein n=1 Tax=Streptomyces tibetensis TaxID=2382123 RepID=UPI003805F9B6
MQDAIYGLLGALGGAALAGAAAYWGPLQAQKAARREAERQREQAEADAAAAKEHERRSALMARTALIRRVVGNWCHLLEATLDEVQQGHAVDQDFFEEARQARGSVVDEVRSGRAGNRDFIESARQARDAVTEAVYEGVHDGVVIVATRRSGGGYERLQGGARTSRIAVQRTGGPLRRTRVSDHTIGVTESEQQLILDALDLATSRVGALVRLPLGDARYPEVLGAAQHVVQEAGHARANLSAQLMQRLMDIVDLDVVDTRDTGRLVDP